MNKNIKIGDLVFVEGFDTVMPDCIAKVLGVVGDVYTLKRCGYSEEFKVLANGFSPLGV